MKQLIDSVTLNVSTTMVLVSDRLFHGFINDVLYNQTVTTYMQGIITITARIPVCEFPSSRLQQKAKNASSSNNNNNKIKTTTTNQPTPSFAARW